MKPLRSKLSNKRGGLVDILLFIITAFVVVLSSVLYIYLGNSIHTELSGTDFANRTLPANRTYQNVIDEQIGNLQVSLGLLRWLSFFLIMGMMIVIWIGSAMLKVKPHPVLFVAFIFLMIIAVLVAIPLANAYDTILNDATIGSTAQSFTGTNLIMLNLPLIVAVVGFVGGIIMFTNLKRGQDEIFFPG